MTEKTVLLVEDNPDDVELTLHAFRESGITHRIVVARDGTEALDYLLGAGALAGRGTAEQPAVVLLDLKLHGLDGCDVLQRIRSDPRTRLIPVVMLTTSRAEEDRRRCYSGGANGFVCKPVDFEHFLEAVRRLCGFWLELNELPPGAPPI